MSCSRNQVNQFPFVVENFVRIPHTPYDQIQKNVYRTRPAEGQVPPAPWPLQRTSYDISMIDHWDTWAKPVVEWSDYPYPGKSLNPALTNF